MKAHATVAIASFARHFPDMPTSPDLDRFVAAQTPVFATVLAELRAGAKRTHWMWFVFPQIAGLGSSATARFYAIRDAAEARAYLADPLLGPRLHEANAAIMAAPGGATAILGEIDAVKLRSSMTLFAAVAKNPAPFEAVLARFHDGARDAATLRLLQEVGRGGPQDRASRP